jgi:hypothetical protein
MSCLILNGGIVQDCRKSMGGVKRFLIAELGEVTAVTVASGLVTGVTKVGLFYEFKPTKTSSTASAPIEQSVENGQISFNHTVVMVFSRSEAAKRNVVLTLAQKETVVIAEDRNGKFHLYGWNTGLSFTEGGGELGTGASDLNGYNITLSGEQPENELEVDPTIIAGLLV